MLTTGTALPGILLNIHASLLPECWGLKPTSSN
jgi:hypothetical protein